MLRITSSVRGGSAGHRCVSDSIRVSSAALISLLLDFSPLRLLDFEVELLLLRRFVIRPSAWRTIDVGTSMAKEFDLIVSIEDGVLKGGLGSSISELLNDNNLNPKVRRFGWPDEFISHGSSVSQLRKQHHLDTLTIFQKISQDISYKLNMEKQLVS